MLAERKNPICAIVLVGIIFVMASSPVLTVDAVDFPRDLNVGPYVDKGVFKVIGGDQEVLSLLADEIDMMDGFFNPVYLDTLAADPDIDIFSALRNGYGHITINCRDAPLNESVLRRAFAFAFDKTAVTVDIMDGFSQEHDSLVPYPNSWCVEDLFTYHYYTDQTTIGNQLLNDSGLFPFDEAGEYRTYKGQPFDINIEYSADSPEVAGGTAQIGVDALRRLHINAATRAADFNEYISRLDSHGDYDMVFYAFNFVSDDVDWLAYEYWSEYADEPYQNPTNFRNETYDSWRNQLLYGTTYEDIYEAAAEMQKILQYNVPRLVVYENTYMQGYRTDQFTGYVEDLGRYIAGPWTSRKIHRIDGNSGGTVRVSLGTDPDSFNIFITRSAYAGMLNHNLWPSLYSQSPALTPWPYIAESLRIETHSDNPAIHDGNTRFTIDIIQNATWSDGEDLTAEDVAFTFNYAFESGAYGNPFGTDIGDLVASYAPTPYRAVIEFNTESYWHFSNFAFDYIIPEHIFNDETGIGFEGWNTWNPVFDPAEPYVTSGPFLLTNYEFGEFYELTANPNFCYYPEINTESTTTTTTSETDPGPTSPFNSTLAITAGVLGAAAVIFVGGMIILRSPKKDII